MNWLYAVQAGSRGPIKLGVTRGLAKLRVRDLQVGQAVTLRLLGETTDFSEDEAHAKWAAQRLRGEWFRATPELLAWVQSWNHRPANHKLPKAKQPKLRPVVRCIYCGKRLPVPLHPGRPRRYCDDRHKNKAYRARVRHLLAKARG